MAVSQVTYSYTRDVPAGQKRVLDGSLKIGGATVDKAAGYRVVLNNFIADGGDGFTVFRSLHRTARRRGGRRRLRALSGAHSPLAPPPLNRITRLD